MTGTQTRPQVTPPLPFPLAKGALPALLALVIPGFALAADPGAPATAEGAPTRRIERRVRAIHVGGALAGHGFGWVGSAVGGKPMKGAPFSATVVTEMEQVLGDGNRIQQKSTSALARDGAGRTRREVALGAVGPLMAGPNPERLVHIHDPVSGTNLTLDPARRTAFKMSKTKAVDGVVHLPPPSGDGKTVRIEEHIVRVSGAPGAGPAGEFELPVPPPGLLGEGPSDVTFEVLGGLPPGLPDPVQESLGTQTIEGVKADGQRSTVTIPAGKIGNLRPITTVTERWFSPELGLVVQSRHSDPRFGTSTYRLTGIDRREPPAAQFAVPADYKMEEGPVLIRKRLAR